MNLHGIVSQVTASINPLTSMTIEQSTGYTTGADGSQIPAYTALTGIYGDVQALSGKDLIKLAGLNIQNVTQKVYLNGDFEGIFRVLGKGGDLLKFGNETYLINIVFERWPDWVCVGITMQLDGA